METFIGLFDLHYGFERRGGHRVPLHDQKALSVALQFCKDFKPDHIILGGDILDCGCVSHHNHGKPGAVEGFRLLADAMECRKAIIEPVEALAKKSLTFIIGNHESWLDDLCEKIPALENIIDVRSVLKLSDRWKIIPNGESHRLGKLIFVHGDQIKGGEHCAKWATVAYEANVRFGHFHTAQMYSKVSPIDQHGHSGICVPCLCNKGPKYGGGSPNKWQQGFIYGYLNKDKTFNDYLAIIVAGKATVNGKHYTG